MSPMYQNKKMVGPVNAAAGRLLLAAAGAAAFGAAGLGCDGGFQVIESTPPIEANEPTPSPTAWVEGHLTITPDNLDFGPVQLRCRSVKEVNLFNDGRQPVRLFGVAPSLTSSPEFTVDDYITSIEPFKGLNIPVAYRPIDLGGDEATLLIQTDDIHGDVRAVPLIGRDSPPGEHLETFFQPPGIPADFIWLLDTSGSMSDDIDRVATNLGVFMDQIDKLDVSYQMALITTSLNDNGEFQGSYGADGLRWITSSMGDEGVNQLKAEMRNQSNDVRQTDERGLDSLVKSLSDEYLASIHKGFIRPGARLVITVFSDENDHSTITPASVAQRLRAVKTDGGDVVFSSVVGIGGGGTGTCPEEEGARYIQLAYEFDGYVENICLGNYTTLMATLGSYGAASESIFPLESQPETVYGFTVKVEGEDVAQAETPESSTGWRYDSGQNAIIFGVESVPPSGSRIDVTYSSRSDCQ